MCLFRSHGSTQCKYPNAAPFCDIAPLTTELIKKHKQSSIVVWAKMDGPFTLEVIKLPKFPAKVCIYRKNSPQAKYNLSLLLKLMYLAKVLCHSFLINYKLTTKLRFSEENDLCSRSESSPENTSSATNRSSMSWENSKSCIYGLYCLSVLSSMIS